MDIQLVPVTAIHVGTRKRPVDANVVRDIAKSIETQGLLQPIGITATAEGYRLIFGAHRLAAYALLERTDIESYLLPDDLTEEEYLLIELQENSARNDLTGGQRKAYAAEVGRLLSQLSKQDNCLIETDNWFIKFIQTSNTPRPTFYKWWDTFSKENGLTLTPKQALLKDREDFFAWLQKQQEQETAEKTRKEEEARAKRRQQDLQDGLDNLYVLATDYGREAVITEVINVFLADQGEEEDETI
jgi:hypothetical protein